MGVRMWPRWYSPVAAFWLGISQLAALREQAHITTRQEGDDDEQ